MTDKTREYAVEMPQQQIHTSIRDFHEPIYHFMPEDVLAMRDKMQDVIDANEDIIVGIIQLLDEANIPNWHKTDSNRHTQFLTTRLRMKMLLAELAAEREKTAKLAQELQEMSDLFPTIATKARSKALREAVGVLDKFGTHAHIAAVMNAILALETSGELKERG